MALNEATLDSSDTVTPGQVYVLVGVSVPTGLVGATYVGDGVPVVCPSNVSTVSDWMTVSGATAVLAIDLIGRRDCFAASGAAFPDG